MANGLYELGRQNFANGEIDWIDDDIRAVLSTSGYTPNLATDEFLSDIPGGGVRVVTTGSLTGKTNVGGLCDASDLVLASVTGDQIVQITLYKHTGTEGTSRLIALLNIAVGLPVTPNGFDITLKWDNGPNKIFKL